MRRNGILTCWAKYYLLCATLLLVALIALTSDLYSGDDPAIIRRNVEWFGLAVIIIMGALAWALWFPVASRLQRIRQTVTAYAAGDFTPRAAVLNGTELDGLASDLNWMAHQLHCRRMVEQDRQRQQEAVLASMIEGVMAIDVDGCFISMNRAAREMLDAGAGDVNGYLVTDSIRQEDLIKFIRRALATDEPLDTDLVLRGDKERHLELVSTALTDEDGHRLGTLIVMNDVTRMRRLEGMRRDFVANVSHELRTPITSIKGFMETLLDGAMDHPDEARRFLEIIAKQADRLVAIIEDLLSLSRVEQESNRGGIPLEEGRVGDVINAAIQIIKLKSEEQGIHVDVDCPKNLRAHINAPLLEQAVVNLLDNAIKYSEKGARVHIVALQDDGAVQIKVRDEGPGIPREHQARIFERFYRVDKSRSRELGGTGLGLSIVKHIAQAHGGNVSVQSAPGKGSAFTISLSAPCANTTGAHP